MKRQLAIGWSVCAMLAAAAAGGGVGVGDKAPGISAGSWWNLPKGMKEVGPKAFKGQIVMVEFWATW